jgi:hypothetical protein
MMTETKILILFAELRVVSLAVIFAQRQILEEALVAHETKNAVLQLIERMKRSRAVAEKTYRQGL